MTSQLQVSEQLEGILSRVFGPATIERTLTATYDNDVSTRHILQETTLVPKGRKAEPKFDVV